MNNHHSLKDAQNGVSGPAPSGPQQTISAQLRHFYNSVQEEGIPDRFVELLERLDDAEKRAGKANDSKDEPR
ncbi:NepR family anti-sigma factor [Allorhizobium undicola]|uniref:NepR family anti-sigma factor n=1 Tax=Allorhizobium undicola TaxID=78527 RepID=UPI000482CDE7|nr:NepR family anti-sigma factor [Allorhizobium undicola]